MPLQDTPYAINITSSELIENRGAHTQGDALMTNPSVSVSAAPTQPSASLSRVFIRGFNASDQNEFRDGLVDRSFTVPPIENVERIEVLNGLSGFLYGFTNPGGAINYVTKKPSADPKLDTTIGVYGGGILYEHIDAGGALSSDKRWQYRANLYNEEGSTYIDGGTQKRDLVSGVVSFQATPGTVISTDFSHHEFELHGQQLTFTPYVNASGQVIVPKAFDASKQYGQDWTYTKSQKDLVGASINSELNDVFTLRAAYRYGTMWRDYTQITGAFTADPDIYTERYVATPTQTEKTHSGYALVDANFSTFDIDHKLTFGFNGTEFTYGRGLDNGGVGPTSGYVLGLSTITSPAYYDIPTSIIVDRDNRVTTQEQSLENYIVGDHITFNKYWSAIAGLNYSRNIVHTTGVTGSYTLGASNSEDTALSPSTSLIFKPLSNVTTYVTYMEGLAPGITAPTTSGGRTISNAGEYLPAATSEQWETGVKTTLGGLDLNAALFRIDKVNAVAQPLSSTTATYGYDGREIHQGLEVTATGKLNDQWTFTGGFTLMDAEVTASPTYAGKKPVNVPDSQFRAYLEYTPFMPGLVFTAGANYDGPRAVDAANTAFLPESIRYDAGVRYETMVEGKKVSANLNVYNLLDEDYWLHSNGSLLLGTPRTVSFALKVAW